MAIEIVSVVVPVFDITAVEHEPTVTYIDAVRRRRVYLAEDEIMESDPMDDDDNDDENEVFGTNDFVAREPNFNTDDIVVTNDSDFD